MALLFVSELILLDAKGNWKLFFKEWSKPYSGHLLSLQLPFSGKCPSPPIHMLLQCHPGQLAAADRWEVYKSKLDQSKAFPRTCLWL